MHWDATDPDALTLYLIKHHGVELACALMSPMSEDEDVVVQEQALVHHQASVHGAEHAHLWSGVVDK